MGGEFVSLPSGRLEGVAPWEGSSITLQIYEKSEAEQKNWFFFYAEMEILSKNMIEQVLFAFVLA